MLPGEVELTARMKDRPFALIGIDTDASVEQLRKVIKENGITWRNTWANQKDKKSLPSAWNIHGYPTVLVIDEKGVLRQKHVGVDEAQLMKELDQAVSAAEKAKAPAK